MGTTQHLGIVIPDSSGVPSRENWVEKPLESVDAQVVAYLRKHYKSDTVATSVTSLAAGAGAGPFAVTFGTPFDVAPRVVVSPATAPAGSSNLVPRALNVTTAGCQVYVYNVGSTAATSTLTVAWIATDLGNS